jgi:hypothetical protein
MDGMLADRREQRRAELLRDYEATGDAAFLKAAECLKLKPRHLVEARLARMQDEWLSDQSGTWTRHAAALREAARGHEGHNSPEAAGDYLQRAYRDFERRKLAGWRRWFEKYNKRFE